MTADVSRPAAIVVGCGVAGLSCGIRLLERGFDVTIVARELPPETTSDVAAAVWYPYRAYPEDRVLEWGRVSYREFGRLAALPASGVSFVTIVELFAHASAAPWWSAAVPAFERPPAETLPPNYRDAYAVRVPLVEMPVYLHHLLARFRELGGRVERRTVPSLRDLHAVRRVIVDCAGLGARELADDPGVYPIRGQVARVWAPWIRQAWIDETGPLALAYIVPRRDGCILGGTAEAGDWSSEVRPGVTADILRRCERIEPSLRGVEILEQRVGLRPGRAEVRLELQPLSADCAVVHNYGHGGAGVTLSWGCAEEVAELAARFAAGPGVRRRGGASC